MGEEDIDLDDTDHVILEYLFKKSSQVQGTHALIKKNTGINPSTLSMHLGWLCRERFVWTSISAGRRTVYCLTSKGEKAIKDWLGRIKDLEISDVNSIEFAILTCLSFQSKGYPSATIEKYAEIEYSFDGDVQYFLKKLLKVGLIKTRTRQVMLSNAGKIKRKKVFALTVAGKRAFANLAGVQPTDDTAYNPEKTLEHPPVRLH